MTGHRQCEMFDEMECEEHATFLVKNKADTKFKLCSEHYLELIDPKHNGEKIKLVRQY